jgi:hypothetical protein
MECPGQAGKLVRGIGSRTGAVTKFSSKDIGNLHVDADSTAQTVAVYTQMRIWQHTTACASHEFDLA